MKALLHFTKLVPGIVALTLTSQLQAQPGNGIRVRENMLLTPEVSASYNWNSNVNVRRRALDEGGEVLDENESDTYISGQVSLALRHWNKSTQTNARAWYNVDNYATFTELDEPSYGATWAGLGPPGAETTFRVNASYQEAVEKTEQTQGFVGDSLVTSELENIAERVKRTESRVALTADQKIINDMRTSIAYTYADFSYDNDRYNDRVSQTISGELNYQFSPKTQPYGRIGIGYDDDDGFEDTAEKPYFLIGVRHQPTAKLDFDFGVGYETYTRTPNEGTEAGTELEDSSLKWTGRDQLRRHAQNPVLSEWS